jgi:hypothetical protein
MRSRRRTARISGSGFDRGYQSSVFTISIEKNGVGPAAAEDPQAEHAVPEYAPSLVAFGRPPLAESVELRVKLDRVR